MYRAICLAVRRPPSRLLMIVATAILLNLGRSAQIFDAAFCHSECSDWCARALAFPPAQAPFFGAYASHCGLFKSKAPIVLFDQTTKLTGELRSSH